MASPRTDVLQLPSRRHFMINILFVFISIVCRIFPHPANFTPVGATAVLAGRTLPVRWAIPFTLSAMVLSDWILSLWQGYPFLSGVSVFVYSGFVAQMLLGR